MPDRRHFCSPIMPSRRLQVGHVYLRVATMYEAKWKGHLNIRVVFPGHVIMVVDDCGSLPSMSSLD